MRILAIKLRAIGDTVIWTAALQSLRRAFPEAEIHTLTYSGNSSVLKNLPAVTVQHTLSSKSNFGLIRKLFGLRARKFDWVLGFHATTSLCRWAWLAGGNQMALHHHSWSKAPRGSVPIPHAAELEDAVTRDLRVVEAMGVKPQVRTTHIELTGAERATAEARIAAAIADAGGNTLRPRYIFLPGAGHHLRRYPKELWLPVAEKLASEGRFQPVVIADGGLSKELDLRGECGARKLPLIDSGSLRDFIANVSRGTRALANDSGPGHIAVALGLKTAFTFGPGCVGDWHPYDRSEHPLFRISVDCRSQGPRDREEFQFCTVEECPNGHRCLRELKVELNV